MIGLAADNHADRDEGVILVGRQRDRAGDLQSAGHGDRLVRMAGRLDRGAGAFEQQVVEVRIEARLDDQNLRHQWVSAGMGRSATMLRP